MSSVNIKNAVSFTNPGLNWLTRTLWVVLTIAPVGLALKASAFEVDFSRRQIEFEKVFDQNRKPASVDETQIPGSLTASPAAGVVEQSLLSQVFDAPFEKQELALLITENGFVPAKVYLRRDVQYTIHIVNVHPREKNASIVLDAFTEHQTLPFGQARRIEIRPKAEGVFSFQSPELGTSGQLIISATTRKPAGQ